jgi:hypothetical protein
MVGFKELNSQLNQKLGQFNAKINFFINFVINKLKNFKNLTLGEQISYSVIAGGILLILISIILFIV